MKCFLIQTIAHRDPSVVAFTVADRGILYINASSPKLPELLYSPNSFSCPASSAMITLYWPLYAKMKKKEDDYEIGISKKMIVINKKSLLFNDIKIVSIVSLLDHQFTCFHFTLKHCIQHFAHFLLLNVIKKERRKKKRYDYKIQHILID